MFGISNVGLQEVVFENGTKVGIASARANVIGGGDWAADRLLPDAFRAFDKHEHVVVRNPLAVRPWQHVLEPISGYLLLAEKLYSAKEDYSEGWNFGPNDQDAQTVSQVLDFIISRWPYEVKWIKDENSHPHEAKLLKLDISKARARLGWQPRWDLSRALQATINWHVAWLAGIDMREFSLQQISDFESDGS